MPKKQIESLLSKIHNKDCIAGLKEVPDESINLSFADPPFNIGYEYDVYDDRRTKKDYISWSKEWIGETHRVLRPDGAFWLAIGDEYAAELKVASQDIGFHCRSWVIWYYTFGVHCHSKFTRSHAHLFHFVKDEKQFTFNNADIRVPSARQLVYNDSRANPKGRVPDDTWILRPQDLVDGFDPDDDVWYFPRVAGTFKERAGFHGCQMPEQLLGRIIRACSNPEDVVLDPFAGSATTLAVAKKLERKWVGFELSKDYAKRGRERLRLASEGDLLDGAAEPQVSAPRTNSQRNSGRPRLSQPSLNLEGLDDQKQGLLEAFRKSCQGYSVDRVVADPVFNESFQTECETAGVGGNPPQRNRMLFRLRKSGILARAGIATSKRTNITWKKVQRYIFASEIAWRQVSDIHNLSLDELLCDPIIADTFDNKARSFAPGFSPLEYRWAALKLRKAASKAKAYSKKHRFKKLPLHQVELSELDFDSIGAGPGVYLIRSSSSDYLFASETDNLQDRLERHLAEIQSWRHFSSQVYVTHLNVESLVQPLAFHTRLVRLHQPELNNVAILAG
jgi:site-specific DNA-methyltransferase (adenine-specific)